jgi:hypothetical protein
VHLKTSFVRERKARAASCQVCMSGMRTTVQASIDPLPYVGVVWRRSMEACSMGTRAGMTTHQIRARVPRLSSPICQHRLAASFCQAQVASSAVWRRSVALAQCATQACG